MRLVVSIAKRYRQALPAHRRGARDRSARARPRAEGGGLGYDSTMSSEPPNLPVRSTRTLPTGYRPAGSIDLSTNIAAQIGLNLAALALLVVFGAGFLRVLSALRPDASSISFSFGPGGLLIGALALAAATVAVLVLHEAAHGLCFWLFTGERPRYGFKGLYAYAAAPDWHLPRLAYAVTGAAPLVLLSLGGLALALVVPLGVLPLLLYALSINAAGAVGDILVLGWVALSPRGTLFRDRGDAVERFVPAA
jgi:hypothetical protein